VRAPASCAAADGCSYSVASKTRHDNKRWAYQRITSDQMLSYGAPQVTAGGACGALRRHTAVYMDDAMIGRPAANGALEDR
jgi:hypothetical protein